jgi:APA family basic amino acid/polyamine antiporter
MVGVGVLTTSGFTVASVGSNQLMLLLWLFGGVVALCGALTVAELATALPRSGGDYVYLSEAYGPLVAFLSGWVSFLIGFGGPIAASAFASATYLLAPLGLTGAAARYAPLGVATAAIVAFAVIHCSGPRRTARAHSAVTLLKLGVLTAFLVAGLAVGWRNSANLADRPPLDATTLQAMVFSLVYISYGYTGWNAAGYMTGEVRDPGRSLPRAVLLGTAGVIVLYLGLNTVYALALPAATVRQVAKEQGFNAVAPVAELASARLFGPAVTAPLSVAVGLTLLASLSAYVLTGPRVAYAMARSGHFPPVAGRVSARTGAPVVATALQTAWALVLLWSGSFENIVIYASVGLAMFSMLTVSSVYVLRRTRPDLPRPFRTPGYPITPAVFLVVSTMLTVAAFAERPWPSLYSLLSILAGIPVYYLLLKDRPPILEYDDAPAAVIEPSRTIAPAGVPERCVICFFQEVFDRLREQGTVREVAALRSEVGRHPVYELERDGRRLTVFHPGVGAPMVAAMLEEVIALGCRSFVACGGAGVLDRAIALGHLVVPTAAVRDEGTSYHYLPPSREVEPSPEGLAAVEAVLARNGCAYLRGKTWTTDALYRETAAKVRRRRAEGCLTVEMEAAALFAVARFRGVTLAQILYGGDDVSGAEWDSRHWDKSVTVRERVFWLAADACLALEPARP